MKKLLAVVFAMCVFVGMSSFAQDAAATSSKPAKTKKTAATGEAKAPLKSLSGSISADGKSFTNAADQKSWDIANPEAVKGHEGHTVNVKAHVYADKNQIHVMSVKMPKEKATSATTTKTKKSKKAAAAPSGK